MVVFGDTVFGDTVFGDPVSPASRIVEDRPHPGADDGGIEGEVLRLDRHVDLKTDDGRRVAGVAGSDDDARLHARLIASDALPRESRMAKKTKTPPEPAGKGRLTVVSARGTRSRFLRGMVTHDLVQRGLSFDDAYAIAQAVRDAIADRDEVTTAEIRDRIVEQVETQLGRDLPERGRIRPPATIRVIRDGHPQPFSRGLLARSFQAAGIDLERAYGLVGGLEAELREAGIENLSSHDLMRRAADAMERLEGPDLARRYRLVRGVDSLPRPLVVYVGGGSGTGKSTLALELAPLLRIYRVNATDTIRQVMRMVFSKQMLPALHSSSFEAGKDLPGAEDIEDTEARMLAVFEEQATRVAVGVRAMVERALDEHLSVVLEGVHLLSPIIPFADLEGAAFQVPLVLTTRDREEHRSRFLNRARSGRRRAERYLENFGSIRRIHDLIAHRADIHGVPLIDTSGDDEPALYAVRLVADRLEHMHPHLGQADDAKNVPTLLLIIDGLADHPVRALGGRTPLEAASTPTLDRLAREGQCGVADPVAPGFVPDTAAGTLALFGQSPQAMKRGPVEALGAGFDLRVGDVALRGNLATLDDNGVVADRRAGRIREDTHVLARALDRLALPGTKAGDVEVRVAAGTEHRLAIVIRGDGISSAINGSDPGDGAPPGPPLPPSPLDPANDSAVWTAGVLAVFEQEARRVLAKHPVNKRRVEKGLPPANAVLTRGAGHIHRLITLEDAGMPLRLACVAGDRTILGLASWLGAETLTSKAMTANLDTDLEAKFETAATALERSDLVVVHVKGADIAAHDRRPDLKVTFLEAVDEALRELVEARKRPWRLAVAGDHATLSESGQHAADPLPVVVWGDGVEADEVAAYDERSAAAGVLGRFPLQLLVGRLFQRDGSG